MRRSRIMYHESTISSHTLCRQPARADIPNTARPRRTHPPARKCQPGTNNQAPAGHEFLNKKTEPYTGTVYLTAHRRASTVYQIFSEPYTKLYPKFHFFSYMKQQICKLNRIPNFVRTVYRTATEPYTCPSVFFHFFAKKSTKNRPRTVYLPSRTPGRTIQTDS